MVAAAFERWRMMTTTAPANTITNAAIASRPFAANAFYRFGVARVGSTFLRSGVIETWTGQPFV